MTRPEKGAITEMKTIGIMDAGAAAGGQPLPEIPGKTSALAPVCHIETLGRRRLRCGLWNRAVKSGGTPLVVFNGIGMNLETLQPLAEAMGGRPILSLDPPGVGGSPDPLVPYTPAMAAGWMAELIDRHDIAQADVLGFSWGGAIAQEFALRHGQRVRRLALAAIGPGWPMIPGNPATLAHLADPRWIAGLIKNPGQAGFLGLGPADRATLTPDFLSRLKHPGTMGYLYQMAALAGWSSVLCLPLLNTPTLVLMGQKDPIIPLANGRLLATLIPQARLEVIGDAGHLFIFSHMQQCVQHLQSFMPYDTQARKRAA